MKSIAFFILSFLIVTCAFSGIQPTERPPILVGAFLGDNPSKEDIQRFQEEYGKKPALVLLFLDWEAPFPEKTLRTILDEGGIPVLTWEPWKAQTKEGIPYTEILEGKWDSSIKKFAETLGSFEKTLYLRFAHEMNGDWYPWSSALIGADNYKAMYRYVKDLFVSLGIRNVQWIFSINWENKPATNDYHASYPGDSYVDYLGIDGYNWGSIHSWSRWTSFHSLFFPLYKQLTDDYDKEIFITEFSTTGKGGDKAQWIEKALFDMKQMTKVKGFLLFNVEKEADWSFPPHEESGKRLKQSLQDPIFVGRYDNQG